MQEKERLEKELQEELKKEKANELIKAEKTVST
jgi:hypothetical protein